MRRNKPWFGPNPSTRNPFFPRSWEGWTVTLAFLLGMVLLWLEGDPVRRAIAFALVAAAYCAVVVLSWGDPDSDSASGWRETFLNRRTLVWLAILLVLAAALFASAYYGYRGGYHMPVPGLHVGRSQPR